MEGSLDGGCGPIEDLPHHRLCLWIPLSSCPSLIFFASNSFPCAAGEAETCRTFFASFLAFTTPRVSEADSSALEISMKKADKVCGCYSRKVRIKSSFNSEFRFLWIPLSSCPSLIFFASNSFPCAAGEAETCRTFFASFLAFTTPRVSEADSSALEISMKKADKLCGSYFRKVRIKSSFNPEFRFLWISLSSCPSLIFFASPGSARFANPFPCAAGEAETRRTFFASFLAFTTPRVSEADSSAWEISMKKAVKLRDCYSRISSSNRTSVFSFSFSSSYVSSKY
jgi:hypothetical protein